MLAALVIDTVRAPVRGDEKVSIPQTGIPKGLQSIEHVKRCREHGLDGELHFETDTVDALAVVVVTS